MGTDFLAFPTSFTQQRLWFLDQLQPESAAYVVTQLVTLGGPLDEPALRAALQELFRRHDTLRTTLPAIDGQPYQLVSSQPCVPLRVVDMRGWSELRQVEELHRVYDAEASTPFDLASGPLVRVSLLWADEQSLLLFAMHHAITDGSSMELLAGEVHALYEAFADDRPSPLPDLPLQYGDYAVWQREWLAGEDAREQLAYWRTQLAGAPPVLDLPWDRPRPAERLPDGATQALRVSRHLSQRVLAFSRQERVTPFMTLLAAFQVLVARLSGARDIVVGTPIAGRARTELEGLIGFFVNTLALRTSLAGNPTLREIVHRAEATAMEAYARQDLPFDRIVAEIAPDRTLAHGPIVQVLFALQNVGGVPVTRQVRGAGDDEVEEAQEEASEVPGSGVKFDLTWALVETEDGIAGHIEYSTALLDGDTVRRWIRLYTRVLAAIVSAPDTPLEAVTLLDEDERAEAIEQWNDTAFEYPRSASLGDLFAAQAAARPEARAVVYGDRALTYHALDRASRALAAALVERGVVAGDRVGVCLPRSVDLITALLAVVRCGAAYVPLDPHYPADRIRALAADADVRLLIDAATLGTFAPLDPDRPLPAVDSGAVAYVMYTSGSTGRPKGCAIPHRAIVRLVRDTNYTEIGPEDRVAQASNVAFDAATFEIWGALLNGATLVGLDRDTALSPSRYAQALRREGVTILFVTTALFNQVAREVPDAFAGVKQVMFGGEPADPRAVRAVLAAGRPIRLQNMYGPTETTTFATFHDIDEVEDDDAPLPIGRPIGNAEVYVLDERLEPQVVGVDGELYIGGDGLAVEYFRAPDLTAHRFVPDPFHPGRRLYRTGDIVRYRADGSLDFVGRRDHQVKVRGFRVELGEIESVLGSHEAIRDAIVAPHAPGGAITSLLGYVVWRNGHHPTVADLRTWMSARLPDYMVPSYWIELDALPLNANGKLDRQALPAPGTDRPDLGIDFAAPATDVERTIAGIWSPLLGIAPIGVHDNFFALGGHSLLATQAVARVRDQLGVDVPVRVMFERPTIAGLAEWATTRAADGLAPFVRGAITRRHAPGPAPLSFSQQRLWFLDQLEPGSTLYNMHTAWTLSGPLNVAALEQALGEVVRRHESLRTHFTVADGVAVQVVEPPAPVHLGVVDLSRLPAHAAEEEYARQSDADTRTPFDLARGPLFRARLFTLSPDDHRLAMTMHHVISDGWSLGVLHRELDALYAACAEGRDPSMPPLPVQYADFAVWQRQRLQGDELAQLIAWWRSYLADAPHLINLPTDRPRPAEQTFVGEVQTKALPPALRTPLEQLGQHEGATLFITLLTAWFVLLHRFSGEDDLVVGTPIANRTRSELEPLIGFFVNTLLIRASIADNPTFRDLLRQVRDAANGAYAHQDMPFERLVAELAPERRLSHTPLFQCFFALQNDQAGLRALHLGDDIEVSSATSMFDLSLTMLDAAPQLAASFEYSTELFDRDTVTRLMGHLERLLEGIAVDPDRPIFGYDLLGEDERRLVLRAFNATARPYPAEETILDQIAAQVRSRPDAVAVVDEDDPLTYAELDARANQLAHHLAAVGVAPGALVGLAVDRSLDMIVALFGILKARAAYVPLDPQYPRARLEKMMADASLAAIVTQAAVADLLPSHGAPVVCLDLDVEAIAGQPRDRCPAHATRADLAYVIYTSGSTGEPKGVPIEHRSLINYIEAACESYDISGDDRVLQFGSLNFDASVEEIVPVLTRGGTLVLRTPEMAASIDEFFDRCAAWGVTVISLPTAFWHEMVARMDADHLALPASLRLVIIGGDRALPERVAAWTRLVGDRVALTNGYGPTESTVVASVQRLTELDRLDGPEVPIGKPIRNTRIYILDAHRQPVPIGVRGELWIAGDSLSPGYLHRPDLTRERFLPDPFVGGRERMYRSGDVARWRADGIVEFRGRADRQVKIRGFRIELGEIETALHQHPAVKESVVVAQEDASGHKRLVAYVVPDVREGSAADARPRQVQAWESVFDDLYADIDPHEQTGFYIKGWESSYTGAPIPAAEVEAWMLQTVDRIRVLRPSRIHEIGCGGSGLMLFRLAPHCESYSATDLSANAVRVLRHQLEQLPAPMPHVTVEQRPAHDQALAPASVDAVLIVSVAQYFPNVEYLLDVVERAVHAVAPGGFVFLGDVRNHALLEAFHASVQAGRAAAGTSPDELRRRIRRHLASEKQLTVDPAFFTALARHLPTITAVEARLQRGEGRNELTCFRYDVILHVGARTEEVDLAWHDWQGTGTTLEVVRAKLARSDGQPLAWTGVPNARVQHAVALVDALADGDGPTTLDDLRARMGGGEPGVDPEDLWRLGEELGWRVDITWPGAARDGRFDVVFRPGDVSTPPPVRPGDPSPRAWDAYANDPSRRLTARELVPELRQHVREHLPAYMVPSHIVVLDALPLTPTGKIDRKALPAPDRESEVDAERAAEPPRTHVEETLARIWAEVLDLPAVSVRDNFFQLGGDSILSIQVIARANEAGLRLTPRQLFQHQTIADLAAVAGSSPRALAESGDIGGDVPLTPIQRWFFGANLASIHAFTQSASFELDAETDLATAQALLDALVAAHDAFRLRYAPEADGWRQFHTESGTRIPVVEVDLAWCGGDADAEQRAIDTLGADLQDQLNIATGPIARAALFIGAPGQPRQLLLVAHHLVVDGVSWRILHDDVRTLLGQMRSGRPLQLPPRTTSFQYWARRLAGHASSAEAISAATYWTSRLAGVSLPLPLDQYEPDQDGAVSSRLVTLTFSNEETHALLQDVPRAYRTQINDVLLAALAQALAAWTGRSQVLLDLEGHGREPLFDEVDLSRTIGWFTSVYPVRLDLPESGTPGEILRGVKEQLRAVPGRGLTFGVLRYLHEDPALVDRLKTLAQPQVCFNYLGQFGAVRLAAIHEDALASRSPEDGGVGVAVEAGRGEWGSASHLIDINGGVNDGRLWVTWAFSTKFHRAGTIEAVARRFAAELRRLIAHCTSAEARGYSPSDFPLAGLDQEKLDWLIGSDREVADLYPLSPMQAGMLFHSLYDPGSGEYVEQSISEMPADLDVAALRRAWDLLVDRHPILRTCFLWSGLEAPLQMVRTHVDLPWQLHDWSDRDDRAAAEALDAYLDEDRIRGFDLARAPLLRFALFRRPDRSWWCLWTSHHVSLDGWSQARLKQELVALYDACVEGREARLDPVRPFRHYIEWLQQQDLSRAEAFWREALRGFETPTPLVIGVADDGRDEGDKTYLEQQITFSVDESAAIDRLARQALVTANTAAQGAWALLLSRYSGETDVLFGATVAGRPPDLAGVEQMVGLFINTLPVRVSLPGDQSVALWLKHLQRHQIDAREFEHAPLVQVQGWSQVRRGARLFDTLFVFENYPDVPSFVGEPTDAAPAPEPVPGVEEPTTPLERTNYPITAAVIPGEAWAVRVTYDAGRFGADDIRRLLGHYRTILTAFTRAPEQLLRDVPVLTETEQQTILETWVNTPAAAAPPLAHQLFEAQAERTPEAIAVESFEGSLTYAALNARANRLARRIRALVPGERSAVGISIERSLDMVTAVLAVLKAGQGYVPLDPAYPADRLAFMLEDSGARVLLTQRALVDRFATFPHPRLVVDDRGAMDGENASASNLDEAVDSDDLAYVIYTSGSTGRPKGVAMPHGPLANLMRWHETTSTPRPGARTLQFAPLSFDVHFQELFSTWQAGGTVVLITETLRRDIPALVRHLATHRVDRLFLPFVALQALAEAATAGPLPPLREVITAGEQLRSSPAIRALFTALPEATLHNHYGPSETHVVTALQLEGPPASWPPLPSIGRGIPGARIYIVDDQWRPVPVGVAGQLCIGGPVLARGYLNQPALTDARFVRDPFVGDATARMYLTGDRARFLADGTIEFLGRTDFQVKVRGFRIELGEIEAALEQHPEIRQCAVSTIEESPGDKRLVAYVVPQAPPGPAPADLRRFLEARLPDYMVPTAWMPLDALPVTPSGKVDRQALPAPDRQRAGDDRAFVAPRDPVEARLAAIYADVLHVGRVGVDDNFFDLGGHSLLATRIVSRIRDAFQVELPLRTVFEAPTVATIARAVLEAGSASLREQRIPRRREAGTCPLSFAQQRLWFLEQLHPGTGLYNVSRAFAFSGTASVAAVREAIATIVRRHEALRTTYASIDGRPFQLIAATLHVDVPEHDLRRLRAPRREREFERVRAAIEDAPFDLVRGPVIRAAFVRVSSEQAWLLVAMHHIATDGWSMDVFARELEACHEAAEAGRHADLPELPVQYADYAVWQRQRLGNDASALELVRCRKRLEGMPASLELPWDRPRPPVSSLDGATVSFTVPDRLAHALLAFSREREVTAYTTLLTGFTALLGRLAHSDDIVIGTPASGRSHSELDGLIGFFVNTLVLRTDLSGRPTFEELLARVRRGVMDAFDTQDVPFDRLVADLAPDRQPSHHPLVQVMFTVEASKNGDCPHFTKNVSQVAEETGTAKFDLTVTLFEADGTLGGTIEYATDLLDADTVHRWIACYQRLLDALVTAPTTAVSDVPLLAADERQRLLVAWNDTARPYPRDASLGALFLEQVRSRPHHVAVTYGADALTYAALDHLSARIAAALRGLGVRPGSTVAVLMDRSPAWVATLLGIVRCGAAYVPLDPAYPDARRRHITEDALASLTITAAWLENLPADVEPDPVVDGDGDTVAYVMYTSGSTGAPKGAAIPHRAIVRLVRDTNYVTIGADDRIAQASHAAFDAATFEVWGALLNGATIVGLDRDTVLLPARYAAALRERRVSMLFVTTALFNQVVREVPDAFVTLRQVMFGGEAADAQTVRAVLEAGAPARLMNVYGPTETTTFATYYEIREAADVDGGVPIGRPIGHSQVYVLDDRLAPQPIGVPGEIYLGGDGLATGYVQAPDLTAARFVPNPFGPGRLYRTGDVGRWRADGCVEFLGRTDHQVKIRGFRIEAGEVEAALRLHPYVADAVVQPHAVADGPAQLVAYVVAADGRAPSPGDLRAHLESRLPAYMIPAHWFALARFPLNQNGKVDRRALPLPDGQRQDLAVAFEDAATPLQTVLATIWRDLLRTDRIGIHDSFFAVGGHSLLATQVISRLRDAIGLEVPVRLLFERPTIAALAEALGDGSVTEASLAQIGRRATSGPVPLSFPQERLWFLEQIDPGTPLYTISDVLTFEGPFRREALEAALGAVVARHDVLRTAFAAVDGVATQIVAPPAPVTLPFVDLATQPRAAREAAFTRLADEEAQRPFVLSRAPLFRATLVRLSTRDHRLLITLHHSVADGWSLAILHRELRAFYDGFAGGPPAALPELPVQYADFAMWQRACLASGALQPQLEYWKRQLAHPPRPLELPLDRPRPVVESSEGARRTLALPAMLAAAVRRLCQRTDATPFMVLLAAFDLILHRYTGETDLVVGCPVAGRTRAEIEPLIGFFLNTLALRVDASGEPTFDQLLARVRQTAIDAFANQDVPYERILEELALDRAARTHLFRVYFNVISFDTDGVEPLDGASGETTGLVSPPAPSRSIFDLTLYVLEQGDTFVLDAVYRTDLFEHATIGRLLEHLQAVLSQAVDMPTRTLAQFSLPVPDRPPAVAVPARGWRPRAFPAQAIEQSIGDRFLAIAARHATRVAVRTASDAWTYADLRQQACAVATELQARGVAAGDRVALLCDHDAPMIGGILGVLLAGGVYVPLDPSAPRERHRQMLADAEPSCIVTDGANAVEAAGLDLLTFAIDAPGRDVKGPEAATRAAQRSRASADSLAYILYTSGSTGQPKGVAQNHRNVLHHCRTYTHALRLAPGDQLALFAGYGFDAAVMDIFGALLNGATLCPIDIRRESPESAFDRLEAGAVTVLHCTPTVFRYLLRNNPRRTLPAVRAVVLGGEEVVRPDLDLHRHHFDRSCVLVNGLGPTESTLALQFFVDHDTVVPRHAVPVGYAVEGTEVLLLTPSGEVIDGAGTGELAFRSRHVALGYWRDPDLTARAFQPSDDDPNLVTYRSGDRARRLPDGRFEFLGRTDLQVKIRGVRIEPGEIETRLLEHPAVRESVVTVVERDAERLLAAYVTTSNGHPPTGVELAAFLRDRLPESMIPSGFVVLDALPLTTNGKIDRRALPAPDGLRPDPAGAFVAPATATERALAAIWSALLRVPEVSAQANFFELGGHSLLATQLASRVRSQLNVDIPLRQYFATPTLGTLAALIDASAPSRGPSTVVIPRVPRDQFRVRVNHAGEFVLPARLAAVFAERATPERTTATEAARVRDDLGHAVLTDVLTAAAVSSAAAASGVGPTD